MKIRLCKFFRFQLYKQRRMASSDIRDDYRILFSEVKSKLCVIVEHRSRLKQLNTAMPNDLLLNLLKGNKVTK